jgi:hypothetical protein
MSFFSSTWWCSAYIDISNRLATQLEAALLELRSCTSPILYSIGQAAGAAAAAGPAGAVEAIDNSSGSNDAAYVCSSGDEAAAAIAASRLTSAVAPALPDIAQQIVALGGALCAQFPLPHCCNNPGCVELRGASELQLVGRKGCVCSRCRWFCSCCMWLCLH